VVLIVTKKDRRDIIYDIVSLEKLNGEWAGRHIDMADKPAYQELLIKLIKCLEAGKGISDVYKMLRVLLMICSHRYMNCVRLTEKQTEGE
jgi:hypothetical protein